MRVATWNVNSLKARLPRVEAWLAECEPDILCMEETKLADSAFPALAARELGLGDVPLLCASELDVIGGNPTTIRVLVHCYSTLPRASLRHVYLHRAKHLRDDLPE